MRALLHLSRVNHELRHFMVGIVDEPCCRIDLQRGADDHEDVGLAHDVNGDIHTVNILAKHHDIRA